MDIVAALTPRIRPIILDESDSSLAPWKTRQEAARCATFSRSIGAARWNRGDVPNFGASAPFAETIRMQSWYPIRSGHAGYALGQ